MRVFIPRFSGAIAYLIVLMIVGTIGYVAIEGWPWREALCMTVINRDRGGFPDSPCTVRAWPGLYGGSSGGRHHRSRHLVRADHLIHRGIRPEPR
jgi:hypothetical protein